MYLASFAAGVGVIYSLINLRSPAPPLVALVGLLGILGEQIIPVGKQLPAGSGFPAAWQSSQCTSHIFGILPGRHAGEEISATDLSEKRS